MAARTTSRPTGWPRRSHAARAADPLEALANRAFLRLAARYLAAEAGIGQFLDVGVGLPTRGAVHEVVREVRPGARVAYVDYDPVVVSHARVLLTEPDRSVAVRGDLRDPVALLGDPEIRCYLDLDSPSR